MKHVLERHNRPQLRRDFIAEHYRLVILAALIACAVIAGWVK